MYELNIENTDDINDTENEDNIYSIKNKEAQNDTDSYINITDFIEIKEKLEKIESFNQKLNSCKSSLSNHEMFLYDNLHELKKEKVRLDSLQKISFDNLCKSMRGKVEDEKKIRLDFMLRNKRYGELRKVAENIRQDVSLIKSNIEVEQYEIAKLKNKNRHSISYIDYMYETGKKSASNSVALYEQQVSDLKNKEKEVAEIIESGKKLCANIHEAAQRILQAESWTNPNLKRVMDKSAKTGSENKEKSGNFNARKTILYQIVFGQRDRNDSILKVEQILYNLIYPMKSFTSAIYNINQNQLSYIVSYEIKDYDTAIEFIDYFYSTVNEDIKDKMDLSDDYFMLDNLYIKINKIINGLKDLKSVVAKKIERLCAEHDKYDR
ncbi:MAG: hypothetical protein FWD71_21430 [Oscillospiraceae bacterium]|nr:hypothetical protein [Oscillospiraceae bacterium]